MGYGSRSTVLMRLPYAVRQELETRLAEKAFRSYGELSGWLKGQGYQVSARAISRYDRGFEQRMEALTIATEEARAIAKSSGGDDELMTEALAKLLQHRLFALLVESSAALNGPDLSRFAKVISDLGRVSISQRRWRAEAASRFGKQQNAAADQVATLEHTGGLSEGAAQVLRDMLLGLNPFVSGSH
jgi:hypothetical protein